MMSDIICLKFGQPEEEINLNPSKFKLWSVYLLCPKIPVLLT